jgi:hypothetical protein
MRDVAREDAVAQRPLAGRHTQRVRGWRARGVVSVCSIRNSYPERSSSCLAVYRGMVLHGSAKHALSNPHTCRALAVYRIPLAAIQRVAVPLARGRGRLTLTTPTTPTTRRDDRLRYALPQTPSSAAIPGQTQQWCRGGEVRPIRLKVREKRSTGLTINRTTTIISGAKSRRAPGRVA